jgi:hypothetical protein
VPGKLSIAETINILFYLLPEKEKGKKDAYL